MAFCQNCGSEVNEKAYVCLNCGCEVNKCGALPKDTGGILWGFLGFMSPLSGVVLWLVLKEITPRNAKSAGIGALVCTVASAVFVVLWFMFVFSLAMFGTSFG